MIYRSDGSVWALRVLPAGAVGMAALLALAPAAGHDQLWFLLMAKRWLEGATIYGPEIFDSNLPGIVWLSAVPVVIGEHLGVSAAAVAKLLVVLLEGGVAVLCGWVLRRLDPALGGASRLFLAFAFVVVFAAAPARDFGQRDQIAGLLCTPYVLLASVEWKGAGPGLRPFQVMGGLLAAAGVCLKPQQALVPLAVELMLLLARRRGSPRRISLPRPEPWILCVSGAVFVACVRVFAPLFFSLTLHVVLASYWAIGHLTLLQLLEEAVQLHVLGAAAVVLWAVGSRRGGALRESRLRPAVLLFVVAGCAATAAYYVQGTGWYYQQLPGIGFFGLALALELVALGRTHPVRVPRAAAWVAGGLAVLALGLTWKASGYPFSLNALDEDRTFEVTRPDPSFFAELPAGTPVAILTTSVDDAMMPVARYRLLWAQRTNNLWLLPAIFRAGAPGGGGVRVPKRLTAARLGELEAMQRQWMDEDLERWKPRVVLVERCQAPEVHCQELEDRHDDLLAFFMADTRFAEIWRGYRFVRRSGAYDEYVLWGGDSRG